MVLPPLDVLPPPLLGALPPVLDVPPPLLEVLLPVVDVLEEHAASARIPVSATVVRIERRLRYRVM
ncbi:MAG: hypothetical protein ACR2P2_01530 [Nakamurella sp.]